MQAQERLAYSAVPLPVTCLIVQRCETGQSPVDDLSSQLVNNDRTESNLFWRLARLYTALDHPRSDPLARDTKRKISHSCLHLCRVVGNIWLMSAKSVADSIICSIIVVLESNVGRRCAIPLMGG